MASTIAFYTGDGATTDFTVPFDYLAKKFVRVSLGVTNLKGGDYGDTSKDYYFLDKTKVRLKVPPQVGEGLTIRRYTSTTDRVVSFKDASVLKATDLDVSAVQTIHIAEEARDIINDALIKDKEGDWDAKGIRIVNVGDAVSDGDAVNLKLYKEDAKGAYQSRVVAEKARDRAVEAETNAKESEAKAKVSETNSKMSETEADASAKNSANSASTATQQATLATQKATEAKTDADKAVLSKDAAKVSETNAKKSEANAKVSETNAKESELKAEQYAYQAAAGQLQADWKQTNYTKSDFIKNKPILGTLSAKDSLAYSELTDVPTSFTPSSHTHPISQITDLQVDLTAIRNSITSVSSKVDGIGDTLSPTYAKKQAILDACDKALKGTDSVDAVDPVFINKLAEKLSKLGTIRPLGFHYLHPYGTAPADSIICNGAMYSRALYKDFFNYILTQKWVKTEAEWQEIATRDNGFCPFYSLGDGSTNFRTPKFAPYQQIASTSASVCEYHQAGIPNIVGEHNGNPWISNGSGCFKVLSTTSANPDGTLDGRSDTVQPESNEWIMCVVVYGVATNVGSVDIQNVLSAVNAVQAQVGKIPTPKTYVTETHVSGTQGYRIWSDGFIEQWGKVTLPGEHDNTLTFQKPFKDTNYNIQTAGWWISDRHACVVSKTTTSVTLKGWNNDSDWYAFGY